VLSLLASLVLLGWLYGAWVMAYFGEGPGQWVLAVVGVSLALCAILLGFGPHARTYRTLVAVAVGCAVVWGGWWLLAVNQAVF